MPQPVQLTRLTPVSFLERTAVAFRSAWRSSTASGDLSWAELRERARRLAQGLQAVGIEKGDRVAFLALNSTELLEAHFGVPAAGGVLVAIDTRLTADEIEFILAHSGARILVVDLSLAHLVAGARVERVVVCGEGGDYEQFLAAAPDGEPEGRLESGRRHDQHQLHERHDGAAGVMYTHRGAYLNGLAEVVHSRLDSRSVYLWTLPMSHGYGWCFPWAVTAIGGTHACLRKVDPPLVWRLLDEEGVTHLCGASTVLVMLASDPAAQRLHRRVLVTTAAGATTS
jgi:fatty-acyl-CoA synthase